MNREMTTPFIATHPGEMIKDELLEREMTQKELAEKSGIKTSVLCEIINGKRSISVKVAQALEKALDIPAEIWLNMQTQYKLDLANIARRNEPSQTVQLNIPVRDRHLLKELARKFGWVCMM